jgi:uncharacterized protein
MILTKQEVIDFLKEHVKEKANLEHSLMVGYSLLGLAKYLKKSEEEQLEWFTIGTLHDIDIEKYQGDINKHCLVGEEILKEKGVSQEIIHSIKSHNDALGIERKKEVEHALFSLDVLSGIIRAYVLMRHDKDIKQAKVSSIKKKLKDKTFAQAIKREEIYLVEKTLNLPIDTIIDVVLQELKFSISLI